MPALVYVPARPVDALTVRDVLRNSFGVVMFGSFMAGVAAIVALACCGVSA